MLYVPGAQRALMGYVSYSFFVLVPHMFHLLFVFNISICV